MAQICNSTDINLKVTFVVNEAEARALDALVGYGDDAFVKVFYEKLGQAYMAPNEAGLRSFFKSIRSEMPGILTRLDKARESFFKKGS